MVDGTFDLNTVKQTYICGGYVAVANRPNGTSIYFISVTFWNRVNNTYCGLQLYYDLLNGNVYTRAIRENGNTFDPWYKHLGVAVSD